MALLNTNKNDLNRETCPIGEMHDSVGHSQWPEAPQHPDHPMPPHARRQTIRIEFEDKDTAIFQEVFGDEDTAQAAQDILRGAPPEIQVLALQVLHMIEKEGD